MFDPERESGGKIGPFLKLLALVCSHNKRVGVELSTDLSKFHSERVSQEKAPTTLSRPLVCKDHRFLIVKALVGREGRSLLRAL